MPLFRGGITGEEIGDKISENASIVAQKTADVAIDILTSNQMDEFSTMLYKVILLTEFMKNNDSVNLNILLQREGTTINVMLDSIINLINDKLKTKIVKNPSYWTILDTTSNIFSQILKLLVTREISSNSISPEQLSSIMKDATISSTIISLNVVAFNAMPIIIESKIKANGLTSFNITGMYMIDEFAKLFKFTKINFTVSGDMIVCISTASTYSEAQLKYDDEQAAIKAAKLKAKLEAKQEKEAANPKPRRKSSWFRGSHEESIAGGTKKSKKKKSKKKKSSKKKTGGKKKSSKKKKSKKKH